VGNEAGYVAMKTQKNIERAGMFGPDSCFQSVEGYLGFYGLDFGNRGLMYRFLPFESGDLVLAGHIFKPAKPKASVLLVHGFLAHCGLLGHLIRYLIERDYAVACFDLPGQGLSERMAGQSNQFSRYTLSLQDFICSVGRDLDRPWHIIGHSFGCAVILDYLLTGREDVFDKVIFAAPLLRHRFWRLSKVGLAFCRPFAENVPRIFRRNCCNEEFLRFVRNKDPLQKKTVPVEWVEVLHRWTDRIAGLQPSKRNLELLQGTADTTVAWRFNVEFLRTKFGSVDASLIKGGGHELFNESEDILAQVLSRTAGYLEEI